MRELTANEVDWISGGYKIFLKLGPFEARVEADGVDDLGQGLSRTYEGLITFTSDVMERVISAAKSL